MKTLILPVEIFRREMDGRLLHALVALRAGWDVIIGANLEISRNIWRLPRGVYLFSTLTYKRLTLSRMLRSMGFATQGWDEEGLVYMSSELYLLRRVSDRTMRNIDQIFAWGEASRRDLQAKADLAGRKVQAIGNPRLDLLRSEFHGLYEQDVRQIWERYGSFILFNSNFSSVNFLDKKTNVKHKKVEKENIPLMRTLYEKLYNHRKFMFARFMEIIPEIACRMASECRIIVRPHPAENADTWRNALRDCPNAQVVSEGPVIPWLLAARALLHNDCTTAVEARLLGCEPIAYMPYDMPEEGLGMLPNGVSHHARTPDELCDMLRSALQGGLSITPAQEKVLDEHVSGRFGPLAAERAVQMAQELVQRTSRATPSESLGTRLFAVGRHAWKEITPRGRRSRKYIAKVFPDDPWDYIMTRLQVMGEVLGVDASTIRMQRLGRNIFLLRRFF